MKTTVLIPVKALTDAKSRLADYLTDKEREKLVLEMLRHVLQTVKSANADLNPILVSSDKKICVLAASLQVKTFPEIVSGHNEALTKAAEQVDPSIPLLTLSADLPLITLHNIEKMVTLGQSQEVVLAPSKEGTGTNALLLRKPLLLPYVFGINSLKKFISEAKKEKLSYALYQDPSIAFDVDTIKDIQDSHFLHKFHLRFLL